MKNMHKHAQVADNFSQSGCADAGVDFGGDTWISENLQFSEIMQFLLWTDAFFRDYFAASSIIFQIEAHRQEEQLCSDILFSCGKKRLNANSFLISPKAPSTWMERHILSRTPSSVVIFSRYAARFSFNCFLTFSSFG